MVVARRLAGGPKLTKLKGIVELDECFIGGKEGNKHEHKKLKAGRGSVGKIAVLGMRERGTGRTLAAPMHERSLQEATQRVHDNIELGTQLYTDEHLIFTGLDLRPSSRSRARSRPGPPPHCNRSAGATDACCP